MVRNIGDVDAAFARANRMHETEYYMPHLAHAPLSEELAGNHFQLKNGLYPLKDR